MTFTPTDRGAFLAGLGVWILAWATLFKLDHIPFVSKWIRRDPILEWVNRNKTLTMVCTEAINFGVHGISNPTSAIFALGGTIWNAVMVFLCIPWWCHRRRQAHRSSLLKKGVA